MSNRPHRPAGFFIVPEYKFRTVSAMIEHYKHHADGLCTALRTPCKQTLPTIAELSHETQDNVMIDCTQA